MLPNNIFAPRSYIHNRKGFVVTRYGTRDIAYILNLIESKSGRQLVIETMVSDNGAPFMDDNKVIKPKIPYRIMTSDLRLVTNLENAKAFNSQDDGAGNVLFNPGITVDSKGLITGLPAPNLFYQPFIELNLDRTGIERVNYQDIGSNYYPMVWQTKVLEGTRNVSEKYIGISDLRLWAQDSKAAIIAINNGNTDDLYIAVTTTIRQDGYLHDMIKSGDRYISQTRWNLSKYQYSLPVLLKLTVSRTDRPNGDVLPSAWRYLFPLDKWANDDENQHPFAISQIDENIAGSFYAKSWNYNIIPATIKNDFYEGLDHTIPLTRGCNWDIVYDENNSRIFSMSAVGNWERADERLAQRINWMVYTLASFSTAFTSESAGAQLGFFSHDSVISHLSGASNGNNILFAITHGRPLTADLSNISLYYFNTTGGGAAAAYKGITSCSHGYVEKLGSTFSLIGANLTTKATDVYICPTVAAMGGWNPNQVASFGNLSAQGFTFLGSAPNANEPVVKELIEANYLYELTSNVFRVFFNKFSDDKSLYYIGSPLRGTDARYSSSLLDSIVETFHFPVVDYRYFRTDGVNSSLFSLPGGVISSSTSNCDTNEYFRLNWNNNLQIVTDYKSSEVYANSGSATIGYWVNPTFSLEERGVKIILRILNCSGIFRKGTGAISDWNPDLGPGQAGVPVNYQYTRPDLSFAYGGYYEGFVTSGGSGNYWAAMLAPSFDLKMIYSTYGDIAVKGSQTLLPVDYDIYGNCSIDIHTYLALDDVQDHMGRSYSDPNYSLSGVVYQLRINTPDNIFGEGIVNINPPTGSGTISSVGGIYKTIASSASFTMTRSAETHITDVYVEKNDVLQSIKLPYIGSTPLSETFAIGMENFKRGDYLSVSYMPLYLGSRGPSSRPVSQKVTYVKWHKYHVDNVEIWIDGLNKTDDITNSKDPYLYVSPGAGSVQVGVVFDIGHETFSNEAYPSTLTRVYPIIENTYMMVVPKTYYPPYRPVVLCGVNRQIPLLETPPVGSAATYPNCTHDMADLLYNRYTTTNANFRATSAPAGSQIELSGETLTAAAVTTGQYHIFLVVEDEFGQRSAWCLTNVHDKYRIPFRRA